MAQGNLPRIPKPVESGFVAIESPSIYEVNVAYVASYARETSKERIIFNDGSFFCFDGIDLRIVDELGNKKHAAIVAELLEPDKSLEDHQKGARYRAIGTDVDSLHRRVMNGAYAMLFAIGNGNAKAGYSPLKNLERVLAPIEKIEDINEIVERLGAFPVAYVLSGGGWGKIPIDELNMHLVQHRLSQKDIDEAFKTYNQFLEVMGSVDAPGQEGLIKKIEELGGSLDKEILFLILNEKFFEGRMNQWILRERFKIAEEYGLGKSAINCRGIIEKVADAETEIKAKKRVQKDISPILNADLPEQEKIRKILETASHDTRFHFEYLNPFENFYVVGPASLRIDKTASLSKEEFEAGLNEGRYREMDRRVFNALEAIRMAGSVKILKGDPAKKVGRDSSYDPFKPDEEPEWATEVDMTFIGYSRHDERKILEMFYDFSGLNPNRFPIYVVGVKNRFINMDVLVEMGGCRDEHHVDNKIYGTLRRLDRMNANTMTDNMIKRARLHAIWKLPAYERLCKDLIANVIDYSHDRTFSFREQILFRHYGDAIKEKFPEILYRFMEQLILDNATREVDAPQLMKSLVKVYSGILYHGLGMSRYDAINGIEINRRLDFLKLYAQARFSLESQVHDEFMREVVTADAKWLDELAHNGITTQLDELLFKHIFPSTDGLYRDLKTLIEDANYVDTIGQILDQMNIRRELCTQDDFIMLFIAKQNIDRIDTRFFPEIMRRVAMFSRGEEGSGSDWDEYIEKVYDTMKNIMDRYRGEMEEVVLEFERDLRKNIDLAKKTEGLAKNLITESLSRRSEGKMPSEHILAALPKIIYATPEVLAPYVYWEVKKEVEKIPKPKEDDTGIGKGDSF